MTTAGIPLDKVELLSALMEALLYGFSLLMFGATVWILSSQQSIRKVNGKMVTVACLLLLFSTAHLVIHVIRVMCGLILYRDTHPGGAVGYFSAVSHWTLVSKNCVYTAQTLIGDSVVLYRCYMVWQSKLVMVLPVLLWCAVGVTGLVAPYAAFKPMQHEVFGRHLSQWITWFYVSALTTNLLTTLLLAYRIWYVDRKATKLYGHQKSRVRPMLYVIIDAGVIYSLTLFATLICFLCQSNGQYVLLDIATPIISITFYMVIIRVGLTNCTDQIKNMPLGNTTVDHNLSTDRRRRIQSLITTLEDNKVDDGPRSPMSRKSDTGLDGVGDLWLRAIREIRHTQGSPSTIPNGLGPIGSISTGDLSCPGLPCIVPKRSWTNISTALLASDVSESCDHP